MADLPARPSLNHLRREARDLLRAAQAGDSAAAGRIAAVSAAPTLAGAHQVAGLVAQVLQAGAGRKLGHDVSFTGLRSARRADKGDRRVLPCSRTEVDYVLPADPEAPSRAYRHGITDAQGHPRPGPGHAG